MCPLVFTLVTTVLHVYQQGRTVSPCPMKAVCTLKQSGNRVLASLEQNSVDSGVMLRGVEIFTLGANNRTLALAVSQAL